MLLLLLCFCTIVCWKLNEDTKLVFVCQLLCTASTIICTLKLVFYYTMPPLITINRLNHIQKMAMRVQTFNNMTKHIPQWKQLGRRFAQTTTSAVGPMAFYDSDNYDPNSSTSPNLISIDKIRVEDQIYASSELVLQNTFQIENLQTPLRDHLHKISKEMNERVYFYNEKNPHLGMIVNVKEVLYNYFQLVGPVKDAWYKVLAKDQTLMNLIIHHIQSSETISNKDPTSASVDAAEPRTEGVSMIDVVVLVESLESRSGVSSLKHSQTVRQGNLMQFKIRALSKRELIALQVLAQYAYYSYELI
jgi:hypothetical protein